MSKAMQYVTENHYFHYVKITTCTAIPMLESYDRLLSINEVHFRRDVCTSSLFDTSSTMNGLINTLRPRQNGRRFRYDIFKWIFLNENIYIFN